MTTTVSRRGLLLAVLCAGTVMAFLGGLTGAYANHQFSDVPDSQPHHDNINAMFDAGCVTGFEDGTFRPGDSITRGQAASQQTRCGTRIAEATSVLNDTPDDTTFSTLGTVAITAGGLDPTHTGYIHLSGQVRASTGFNACPCVVSARFHNDNTNEDIGFAQTTFQDTDQCADGVDCTTLHVQDVVPAANTTAGNTYRLQVRMADDGDGTGAALSGHIIAEYVPFDGNPTD